jgi:hypothetical protein
MSLLAWVSHLRGVWLVAKGFAKEIHFRYQKQVYEVCS